MSCLRHICLFQRFPLKDVLFYLSHSALQIVWNWFLCIMWGRSWDILFLVWVLNWPSTIYGKDLLLPTGLQYHLCHKYGTPIYTALFPGSLLCSWVSLSLLALAPHCLHSHSFIKSLGIQFRSSFSSCLGSCWPLASFWMCVFAMVPPTPRPLHMFLLLKHPSLLSSPG